MKKSKFVKTLVALAVSIVAAIGCISLAACGGGETVNSIKFKGLTDGAVSVQVNEEKTLQVETDPADVTVTWSSADPDKVTVDSTGKIKGIAVTTSPVTVTAKAGDKSATCSVTVTAATGGGEGGGAGGGAVTYETTASVMVDIGDFADETALATEKELEPDVISVTASSEATVKINGSTKTVNNVSYTKRLQMSGAGKATERSLKIVLSKAAKIEIIVVSSSNKEGGERTINLYDSSYTAIEGQTFDLAATSTATAETLIAPAAGTYYVGSLTGGWNVYGINIYYAN